MLTTALTALTNFLYCLLEALLLSSPFSFLDESIEKNIYCLEIYFTIGFASDMPSVRNSGTSRSIS